MSEMAPLWALCSINDHVLSESTPPDYVFDYVDISSVSQGSISEDLESYNFRDAPSRARRLACAGDVLVSTVRTYLRAIAQVQGADVPRVYSTGFAVLHPHAGQVDSRYLAYLFSTDVVVDEIVATSTGVSYPAIQGTLLHQIRVPYPPFGTQQAIADYLDHETGRIDTMIAKLDELAETLEDRRIQLVRGETLLMPDGKSWPLAPIGYLFRSIGSGTTPRGEKHYTSAGKGVPWATTSELRENTIFSTSKNVTKEAVSQVSGLTVHPTGSVLIAMYGATIGRLGILGVEATTNQACCVFSGPEKVDSKFFYYTLLGQRDDIIQEGQGGGQPNINQGLLRRWKIPLPPFEEQRRIADYLDETTSQIDTMLAKVAELKDLLTERRAALITAVVTGRKDVA